jgi:hypothetical protein
VFDVKAGHDTAPGARLAQGIFRKPGIYPATVRFANSDSRVKSDFKPDVRSLSFSVNLTWDGATLAGANSRQDFFSKMRRFCPSTTHRHSWRS